jgi:class 3 adenylate cyclase
MNERAFSDILAADTRGAEIEAFLERRTEPLAILFVDLCGSSALKQRPQRQWLPIVCRFLYEITQQIVRQEGRVVKYIGDEVMAVFEEQTGRPAALRAMAAIQQSDAYIRSLGSEYVAKFAADLVTPRAWTLAMGHGMCWEWLWTAAPVSPRYLPLAPRLPVSHLWRN